MKREEFDEILEQTNAVICNREWYERAIKALEQELCEECIRFPKGALKMRGEGYVVYNYDWLKKNWQTELKVMGIDWKEQE